LKSKGKDMSSAVVFTACVGDNAYFLRDDEKLNGHKRFSLFKEGAQSPMAVFGAPREWSIIQSLPIIIDDIL
jgi:hypothetical protein